MNKAIVCVSLTKIQTNKQAQKTVGFGRLQLLAGKKKRSNATFGCTIRISQMELGGLKQKLKIFCAENVRPADSILSKLLHLTCVMKGEGLETEPKSPEISEVQRPRPPAAS